MENLTQQKFQSGNCSAALRAESRFHDVTRTVEVRLLSQTTGRFSFEQARAENPVDRMATSLIILVLIPDRDCNMMENGRRRGHTALRKVFIACPNTIASIFLEAFESRSCST
jgi:hypothetical protein